MASRLILNRPEITALLTSEKGPVGTDLTRRVLRVHAAARRLCPVDTGRLRSSIRWSLHRDARGLVGLVGSDADYACILGSRASITVEGGTKTIGQVRPGDRVLTQTGEYREVIKASRFPVAEKPDLIDIEVPWRSDRSHRLTVTADHKFLVQRDGINKWVCAGDLRFSDGLLVRTKRDPKKGTGKVNTCSWCGIEHRGQGEKFCSSRCRDDAWKEDDPKRGRSRGSAFSAIQSESRRKLYAEHPEMHPNAVIAARGRNGWTEIERTVASWLDARGVAYEHHRYIGRIWADFYLPESHQIIEADGAYWHRDQKKDIARDWQILEASPGVEILHIHFHDPRHSPRLKPNPLPNVYYVTCNPSPDSYADPHGFEARAPSVLRPWRWQRRSGREGAAVPHLFDLSVEGVHSFMANGILLSNSYVHEGTRPHWAPPGALAVWARRHGFPVKGGDFLVRRSIAVKGTPARPFLLDALKEAGE